MNSMNNRLTQTTPEVPEEVEIQTSTLRLVAKCWGKPEGLPVLALHGWLDNAATFDHLAPFLPEFRLVSLDLPGQDFQIIAHLERHIISQIWSLMYLK